MSRTKKEPYTKSKQFDSTCRSHGSCEHCKNDKIYFDKKMRQAADEQVREWKRFWQTDDFRELDNAGWYGS